MPFEQRDWKPFFVALVMVNFNYSQCIIFYCGDCDWELFVGFLVFAILERRCFKFISFVDEPKQKMLSHFISLLFALHWWAQLRYEDKFMEVRTLLFFLCLVIFVYILVKYRMRDVHTQVYAGFIFSKLMYLVSYRSNQQLL